jgi:hypothetical protein
MDTSKNEENILLKLKTKTTALSVTGIYVFLIVITLVLLYNQGLNIESKIQNIGISNISTNPNGLSFAIFGIITFTLLCIAFMVVLLPNFQNLEKLFEQMKSTLYVILYTIFLIIFFRMIPSDTLNEYAIIFTSLTLIGTIYFFSKAFQTNYVKEFNVNYERIKMITLFFSLITIMIIYYTVDPGGYIQKYFGYSLLLTTLITIFSFLYLLIVLTLQSNNPNMKGGSSSSSSTFFSTIASYFDFSGYNIFIWVINILFITFLILLGHGIQMFPSGFFSNIGVSTAIIIFTLLIFIIWGSILTINYSPEITNKLLDESKLNLFKRTLLVILGIVIAGLVIAWLIYNIKSFTGGETTTFSLFLNIMIALLFLTFVYKIINVKAPPKNNKNSRIYDFLEVIKKFVFYIPCLLSELFDLIVGFFINEYHNTSKNNLYFCVFTILIILLYFLYFYLRNLFLLQGGKLLINEPMNTSSFHSIASYTTLNSTSLNTTDDDSFQYQYGLSFWLYIDSMPPNTNSSYTKYTSVLNYGNKPNILYNAQKNTLLITMDSGMDSGTKTTDASNNELDDENNSVIIYKNHNFLLQKWNQFIINFNGGTLDIFMNGELVKSVNGIVPYMSLDSLEVGSANGIQGGICNLLYFKRPLTAGNIFYLYQSCKDKKIPIF